MYGTSLKPNLKERSVSASNCICRFTNTMHAFARRDQGKIQGCLALKGTIMWVHTTSVAGISCTEETGRSLGFFATQGCWELVSCQNTSCNTSPGSQQGCDNRTTSGCCSSSEQSWITANFCCQLAELDNVMGVHMDIFWMASGSRPCFALHEPKPDMSLVAS